MGLASQSRLKLKLSSGMTSLASGRTMLVVLSRMPLTGSGMILWTSGLMILSDSSRMSVNGSKETSPTGGEKILLTSLQTRFQSSSSKRFQRFSDLDPLMKKLRKWNKKALLEKVKQQCSKVHPVGEPAPRSKYTTTNNFNYKYGRDVDLEKLYSIFGKEGSPAIDERSCDKVDCLHPCYGENMLGACSKCV